MILLLDVGNTQIKGVFVNEKENLTQSSKRFSIVTANCELSDIWNMVSDYLEGSSLDFIGIASVKPSVSEGLLTSMPLEWSHKVFQAMTEKTFLKLVNSYSRPGTMGVDRWLAMISATDAGSCGAMVVDCGTALTVDFVDGNGMHVGGYITAGLKKQLEALTQGTERVFGREFLPQDSLEPGNSTQDCVIHGLLAMVVSFINTQIKFALSLGIDRLVISGGDAKLLNQYIKISPVEQNMSIEVRSDLVFEGLLIRLEEERKKK